MSTFKSRYTDFFRLDYLAIFVQKEVSDLDEILEVVGAFGVDPRVDPFGVVVVVVGIVAAEEVVPGIVVVVVEVGLFMEKKLGQVFISRIW